MQSQPSYDPPTNYDYPQEQSQTGYDPSTHHDYLQEQSQPLSFDPFAARYDNIQQRERQTQPNRSLPIFNDDEDDEYVPETQPDIGVNEEYFQNFQVGEDEDEDVKEIPVLAPAKKGKKFQGRAERQPWTISQEVNLAKSWVHISCDSKIGNQQTREGFWTRVLKHYKALEGGSTRTHHQLNSKWTPMNTKMTHFNAIFINAVCFILIFLFKFILLIILTICFINLFENRIA